MNLMPVKNFAWTTLVGGMGVTDISMQVSSIIPLSNPNTDGSFEITIWDSIYSSPHLDPNVEIVSATALTGSTYTIVRAQGGTFASTHNTFGHTYNVVQCLTENMFNGIASKFSTDEVNISNLQIQTGSQSVQISNINSEISTINVEITTINGEIDVINDEIAALQGEIVPPTTVQLGEPLSASTLVRYVSDSGTPVAKNIVSGAGGFASTGIIAFMSGLSSFNEDNNNRVSAKLSDTLYVALYNVNSGNADIKLISTASGSPVVIATATYTGSINPYTTSLLAVNSTTFIFLTSALPTSTTMTAVVYTISGSIMTPGSPQSLAVTVPFTCASMAPVTSSTTDTFLITGGVDFLGNNSSANFAIRNNYYGAILTINMSNAITLGAQTLIGTGTYGTGHTQLTSYLSDNTFVFVNVDVSNNGFARVLQISGSSITSNTNYYFATSVFTSPTSPDIRNCIAVAATNANTFIVAYALSSQTQVQLIVGTISGTAISYGAPYTIPVQPFNVLLAVQNPSNILLVTTGLNSYAISISGTTINTVTQTVLGHTGTSFSLLAKTALGINVVVYVTSSGNQRTVTMGLISPPAIVYATDFIGILQAGGNTGQTVRIALKGDTSSVHSSLLIGSQYYIDPVTGALTTAISDYPVGKSLSSTNLLLSGPDEMGSAISGVDGHIIQYNSSSLPTEKYLNFMGNVLVTDDPAGQGSVVTVLGGSGSIGPQGLQGAQGPQGIQGPQGVPGIQGPSGSQGSSGVAGTPLAWVGEFSSPPPSPSLDEAYRDTSLLGAYVWTGSTWSLMVKDGPQGSQGIQGPSGSTGAQGIQGIQGIQGSQGIQGIQGLTGPSGPQGIQGTSGSQGPSGSQGIQGIQGPSGSQGATGTMSPRIFNSQAGTSYTLQSSDAGGVVAMTSSSASVITVPASVSVPFPLYTEVDVIQMGTGKVTFGTGSGVTLNSQLGNKSIAAQYVGATLLQTSVNSWVILGNLIT